VLGIKADRSVATLTVGRNASPNTEDIPRADISCIGRRGHRRGNGLGKVEQVPFCF
jgi:hypothetical protein